MKYDVLCSQTTWNCGCPASSEDPLGLAVGDGMTDNREIDNIRASLERTEGPKVKDGRSQDCNVLSWRGALLYFRKCD